MFISKLFGNNFKTRLILTCFTQTSISIHILCSDLVKMRHTFSLSSMEAEDLRLRLDCRPSRLPGSTTRSATFLHFQVGLLQISSQDSRAELGQRLQSVANNCFLFLFSGRQGQSSNLLLPLPVCDGDNDSAGGAGSERLNLAVFQDVCECLFTKFNQCPFFPMPEFNWSKTCRSGMACLLTRSLTC